MKKLIALLMLAALPLCAAEQSKLDAWFDGVTQHQDASPFQAHELQIDIFGSSTHPTEGEFWGDSRGGVGLGVNYFISRYIGLGISAEVQNANHSFVDVGRFNLYGRLPIKGSRFAPYFLTGAGYDFEGDDWLAQSGLGLEFRLGKHFGIYAQGAYQLAVDSAAHDSVVGVLGLRLVF